MIVKFADLFKKLKSNIATILILLRNVSIIKNNKL